MAAKGASSQGLSPIEILTGGRKSRAKPLSPGQQKAAVSRLARKAPEVMVKVSGGGKTVQHVVKHLTYITRNGKLEAETDEAEKISNKEDLEKLMLDSWGIDLTNGIGKNKLVFNIVMSMPAGTDSAKLLKSVKEFARDEFYGQREYLMVLHEPETDPSKTKAEHPHVHLVVKAEGHDGKRLYIRKATLEKWREQFAEKLREQGIEANATPRILRGNTLKSINSKLQRLESREGRQASDVFKKKFDEVRKELDAGNVEPKPWDIAITNHRQRLVWAIGEVAKSYRDEGDTSLAKALEDFAAGLPAVITERQMMRQSLQMVKAQRKMPGKDIPSLPMQQDTAKMPSKGLDKAPDKDR